MPSYSVEPVAFVKAVRTTPEDDFWGATESHIVLADTFEADALQGLEAFSHVEIVFLFDRIDEAGVITGARHPRNNPAWPKVGVFAQRTKHRPNRLGCTICRVVKVEGRVLTVAALDAIDGTPVIDIKPVIAEFLPDEPVTQPQWATELMREYWSKGPDSK